MSLQRFRQRSTYHTYHINPACHLLCSDPLQAIEEFQVENGILLPSLRPMMPLLDLHGVKRLDFHLSVMEVK